MKLLRPRYRNPQKARQQKNTGRPWERPVLRQGKTPIYDFEFGPLRPSPLPLSLEGRGDDRMSFEVAQAVRTPTAATTVQHRGSGPFNIQHSAFDIAYSYRTKRPGWYTK